MRRKILIRRAMISRIMRYLEQGGMSVYTVTGVYTSSTPGT